MAVDNWIHLGKSGLLLELVVRFFPGARLHLALALGPGVLDLTVPFFQPPFSFSMGKKRLLMCVEKNAKKSTGYIACAFFI